MDVLPINERCFKKVVRAVGFSFATFLLGMGHGLNPPEKPSLPKEPSVVGDTSKGIQTGEIQFRFGYVRPNKEAKLKKQYQRAQAIVQRVISGGVDTLSFKEKLELWGGYEKLTFPYVRCPEEGLIRKG